MDSLTLKGGSKVEVVSGDVTISGNCVQLIEYTGVNSQEMVVAYALQPGEIVRRIGKGEYIVEF